MSLVVSGAVTADRRADQAAAWDERVERALSRGPRRLQAAVGWLREPSRRWVRLPAGGLLVMGSFLAILPVFGLWMLPLGLALIGEDVPPLKAWLERTARRAETLWRRWRRT